MRDVVYLGPCPADEECAQVGSSDYEIRAQGECEAYIELIRARLGKEPEGARLRVKWQAHDLGSYAEVVCEYDDGNPAAVEYAFNCDSNGPTAWDEEDEE